MALSIILGAWHDVPHEPGERLRLRALTGRQLREAREIARADAQARISKNQAALSEESLQAIFKAVETSELATAAREAMGAGTPDRELSRYDVATVIAHGVTGWTYTSGDGIDAGDCPADGCETTHAPGAPIPCDAAHAALLDTATETWAAQEIINASVREVGEEPGSGKPSRSATSRRSS